VHGAWVGEWSWLPVMDRLEASGRPVHTVSLTGHGARRHQSGPHVTLATHVDDVVGVIETLDLSAITLVGHSYGGRVITQVATRVPDRLRSMVYLDAHAPVAPDPGQSPERIAAAEANGGMLPFEIYEPDPAMIGGAAAYEWFMARTMPQSFACIRDPWAAPLPDGVDRHFVFAGADDPSRFQHYADAAREDPTWRYHELAGPHWLMMSHPGEVADIILEA